MTLKIAIASLMIIFVVSCMTKIVFTSLYGHYLTRKEQRVDYITSITLISSLTLLGILTIIGLVLHAH